MDWAVRLHVEGVDLELTTSCGSLSRPRRLQSKAEFLLSAIATASNHSQSSMVLPKKPSNGQISRPIKHKPVIAAAVLTLIFAVVYGILQLSSNRAGATRSMSKVAAAAALAQMPPVGLGTFGLSPSQVSGGAIKSALDAGYRLIDCAPVYFNEREIGDALSSELTRDGSTIKREDLWITSKLASPFHRREHVEPAVRKTLRDLNLDYLDLFLMHWPVAFHHVPIPDGRGWPNEDIDDSGGGDKIDVSVTVRETWSAMEDLVDKGLVRTIGVSNFNVMLLHELLADCRIPPAVNQVELHVYLQQQKLVDYCSARGVKVQAYSPLGTPGYKEEGEPSVLEDPVLVEMAKDKGVSVSHLCIAWALKRGTVLNVKSRSAQRQTENLSVLSNPIALSDEDMKRIAALDRSFRYFRPEDWWPSMSMAVFD